MRSRYKCDSVVTDTEVCEGVLGVRAFLGMDHRLIQPASRDQIVAIIRQRAERANRDLPAHLGQVLNITVNTVKCNNIHCAGSFPSTCIYRFPRQRQGKGG